MCDKPSLGLPWVVQHLLGNTKSEINVRYLGIKKNDALEMSKQTEVLMRPIYFLLLPS